ncbi:MAG: C39 family peptidase, partial [Candidatus Bipolaricaulota bacterium]
MQVKGFLWFAIGLVALLAMGLLIPVRGSVPVQAPERMILTGVPPLGPTRWRDETGVAVPAGCGPEAARMLLSYYDRRYGYGRLVREDPSGAIVELHRRMGTVTVGWEGERQGLTWPWAFTEGLRAYIEARYPGGASLETLDADLAQVFAKSVELIQRGVPHVILFDWTGAMWIFPNHYAVVVGYNQEGGRKELVINLGWGYDFQVLDMSDP